MRPSPVRLPPGPLRRFRLPASGARRQSFEPGPKRRAWALLPFAAFGLLTYWLSAGRPLPDVRDWLQGPPRADTAGREESLRNPPLLQPPSSIAASHSAAEEQAAAESQVSGEPPEETTPPPSKRPKRKPPLVLERHRLRPVLGWEEASKAGSTLGSRDKH